MGYGQFVGNASVHWHVDHEAKRDLECVASDDAPGQHHRIHVKGRVQGSDPNRGESFRVTLRFASLEQARAAFEEAAKSVGNGANGVYLTFTIPALRRPNANAAPPPEVRVYW